MHTLSPPPLNSQILYVAYIHASVMHVNTCRYSMSMYLTHFNIYTDVTNNRDFLAKRHILISTLVSHHNSLIADVYKF